MMFPYWSGRLLPPMETAANKVLDVVSEYLGVNTLFVALNDGYSNMIVKARNRGPVLAAEGTTLDFRESYCYVVAQERHYVEIPDTARDERTRELAVTHQAGSSTFVGIPIVLADGAIVGTICGMDTTPFHLESREIHLLEAMADFLARVVELEHAALSDPLTNLGNRRLLEWFLGELWELGRPKTIAFFDIDNLKPINDHAGHDAGDEAIRRVASSLTHCFSEKSLICRIGGDEFAVVIPDGTESPTRIACERAVEICHQSTFGQMQLSVTAGVSSDAHGTIHGADLLALADEALYRGKRHRKGSVIVLNPGH